MKIRSLELRNFRKFVGAVRVDGIGDGLNVLVGRNEYGKSTLLDAINGVIFEKATAQSERSRSFRHFVNSTVPEVALSFDLGGERWQLRKRFAGQAGKVELTGPNDRRFASEEAEAELQRLVGFERGPRNVQPGIWGTLWVQQGKSFSDTNLDDLGRRSLQECIEAQVGVVTGGQRGRTIPAAVEAALGEIQTASRRTPRGKYKEAVDRRAQTREEIAKLEAKRDEVSRHMDELAGLRRDRRRALADWDEEAQQRELSDARERRTAAQSRAKEIAAARSAAKSAAEREEWARTAVAGREALIAGLGPLASEIEALRVRCGDAEARQTELKSQGRAAEQHLVELRQQQREGEVKLRRLARMRTAQAVADEITGHEETLAKAAQLRGEVARLTEVIGGNPATPENLVRVEEASAELEGARAAVNAVATKISFSLLPGAVPRVLVDGEQPPDRAWSMRVTTSAKVAVSGVGEITIDPQIAGRATMNARLGRAQDGLRDMLEAAGAADLPAARRRAAERQELVRGLADRQRDIARLTPADRARKLPAGIEAREMRLGELRGRLAAEMEAIDLQFLPATAETEDAVAATHRDNEALSAEIDSAMAGLEGPTRSLANAEDAVRDLEKRLAVGHATLDSTRAELAAGRARCGDDELRALAAQCGDEAGAARAELARFEREQGETVEEIDVRIDRLEKVCREHVAELHRLGIEIKGLESRLEADEGLGVEEKLDEAKAEEALLDLQVNHYKEEAAVLELLRDTLRAAESEAKQRYLVPVTQRVGPYLRMLLPEADVAFDEDLGIGAITRGGASEEFAHLSAGTQEQLAVLTRLAFAELLLDQGRPATVILDDALVFSDDDRIERMFDILMRAAAKVQIIVLTCRRRLFSRLGVPALQIVESVTVP